MKQAIILFSILFSLELQAQKSYSITIDADNDQFFSVAIGKKIYPSSSIGHLIISGLKDSTFLLAVSFPRSNYTSESFTIPINKKDHKYQLRKISEKQWNLIDIQTNLWVKQKAGSSQTVVVVNEEELARSREAFKKLMAAVVNDTAILHTEFDVPAPKKEVIVKIEQPETIATGIDSSKNPVKVLKDSSALVKLPGKEIENKNTDTVIETKIKPAEKPVAENTILKKQDSSVKQSESKPATNKKTPVIDSSANAVQEKNVKPVLKELIVKLHETNNTDSKEILFAIRDTSGINDTVKISIALEKDPVTVTPSVDKPKNEPEVKNTDTVVSKKAESVVEKPIVVKDSVSEKMVIVNSDCRNFATESDLDKLRVKMISENRLEERIVVAKKVFKTKCFTTRQIRALSELFVSDKTRYEFFDAAYPFVSDTANFKSLMDLLSDEYYIGRFKAMVRVVDSR